MDTLKSIEPVTSASEMLACLLAEMDYWRNSNVAPDIQIGATGALSNVIAFATVRDFRADWHPEKPSLMAESKQLES